MSKVFYSHKYEDVSGEMVLKYDLMDIMDLIECIKNKKGKLLSVDMEHNL